MRSRNENNSDTERKTPPALPAPKTVPLALPEPDSIRPDQLGDMFQGLEADILGSPRRAPEEDRFLCVSCRFPITAARERIKVQESFRHVFTNPDGIVFEIGCFRQAAGCREVGEPSLEFTWFSDYAWEIALCRNCDAHLGWLYASGDNSFYGLILERLLNGS